MARAAGSAADCVAVDLEDGVAIERKADARRCVAETLPGLDFDGRERVIRVNGVASGWMPDDVQATLAARPDGYILAKVECADDVRAVDAALTAAGPAAVAVQLWATIETAAGVMNLREITQASPRLTALLFGAEDYAASVGALRSEAGTEVLWARSAVVAAAAACGLDAIDQVRFDLNDLVALADECRFGRQLGYVGKMAIHPRQLEVINAAFTPDAAELARARRIIEAAAEQRAAGRGVFALDGRMIDGPVIRAAERALSRAVARRA